MTADSPTLSTCSADEALFELLGIDKFSLANEDGDASEDDANDTVQKSSSSPSCSHLTVPPHCHRPQTPHGPLLLETSPLLLSKSQCRYIIYNLGYRATNNGGDTYGPQYIVAASHYHNTINNKSSNNVGAEHEDNGHQQKVKILQPNHHKVCVFGSDLVLKWISSAFDTAGVHKAIEEWWFANNKNSNSIICQYKLNPRLRLLRYDACEQDIFLPHYDATTFGAATAPNSGASDTIGNKNSNSSNWESKLTVLLYLNTNTGRGDKYEDHDHDRGLVDADFEGGNTLFLNALQPTLLHQRVVIAPQCGKFVVFNHELYHASQELEICVGMVCDDIVGGTKFVLRTDVLFPPPPSSQQQEQPVLDGPSMLAPPTTSTVFVYDMASKADSPNKLLEVLQQLDMDQLPVATFLFPGKPCLESMLVDLGLDVTAATDFIDQCLLEAAK